MAARLHSAPDDAWGIGQLTVTVAVDQHVELPLHRPKRTDVDLRRPTLMTGTLDSIVRAAEESMAGQVPTDIPWWGTIFNSIDPSQAPAGQDVIQLYSPMTPSKPHGGWAEWRTAAAQKLVSQARPVLSTDLREIGRYIETPADRAERVGTNNGCIYHIDFLPNPCRPVAPCVRFRPLPHAGRRALYLGRRYTSSCRRIGPQWKNERRDFVAGPTPAFPVGPSRARPRVCSRLGAQSRRPSDGAASRLDSPCCRR